MLDAVCITALFSSGEAAMGLGRWLCTPATAKSSGPFDNQMRIYGRQTWPTQEVLYDTLLQVLWTVAAEVSEKRHCPSAMAL